MSNVIIIAVVDDQALIRQGILALFKDFPDIDVVIEAKDGEDLLQQLKKRKPDIILLDLQMPGMDGFETAEQVAKKYPDIKIIALTTHNEESFIRHLVAKGARGFMLKDHDIESVVDAIYAVLETGYFFNDRMSRALVKSLMASDSIRPTFNQVDLTERELQIIRLISKEYTAREIADKLFISQRTVDGHRERILAKTKAKNSVGIIMYAIKHHLLDI
jgi:DNA-binding NarL/FixJ family response regulator